MKTAFTQEQYDEAYPDGIDRHWWSYARSDVLASLLDKLALRQTPILEVGAGRGFVVKGLRERGFECDGVELADSNPIAEARAYLRADCAAEALPLAQRERYEVILLLDVIEHIEDADAFMAGLRDAFPKLKRIIVTVPAGLALWSNYDEFYGHFRRYNLAMLEAHAQKLGAQLEHNHYFFRALYLPAWCLLKLGQKRSTQFKAPPTGWKRHLHVGIAACVKLDYFLLPKWWGGSSAIASFRF